MFAFFGLGITEMIVLGVILIGLPGIVMIVALAMTRGSSRSAPVSEIAILRDEIRELRAEIERLKAGKSTDIK